MAYVDFIEDEEEKSQAVAQTPRPIIPPPASLAEQPHYLSDAEQEAIWQQAVTDPTNRTLNRDISLRERIRNSPLVRRLVGPPPLEMEARREVGFGSSGSPGEIAEMMLKFVGTAPPPIANPIRSATDPVINLIPNETARGVARGGRELVMSLPGIVATGQILPSSSAVLAAFAGQAVWNLPEQKEAFDRAIREGNKTEAAQIATEAFGMGALLTAGAAKGATTSRIRPEVIDPSVAQDIALQLTDPRYAQRQVVLPETLRELAIESSTTGRPNAIREQEAGTAVRGVSGESGVNEPLSAEEGGGGIPPRGVPPGDEAGAPRAEEAGQREVPLKEQPSPLPERFQGKSVAETADLVKGVTTEELANYKGTAGAGPTGFMWDLGAKAKTAEDVAALRKMGEDASAETKALMDKGDMMGAMKVIGRQPAEAYEYATGVKLDGTPKWDTFEKRAAEKGQTYRPSVPDPQYLKAKVGEPLISKEQIKGTEQLPSDLPSLARLRISQPELRPQIDAKIAELQSAAAPAAAALKQLPPVPAGHVRLFHGEGGPQGGGTGGSFYTSNITKASTFGPDISWVDLPTAKAQAAFAKAKASAFAGGDNFILEAEDINRSQKIGQKVEPPTHVLEEEPAVATSEPSAPKGIAATAREPGALTGGEAGAVSLAPLEPSVRNAVEFVKGIPTTMKVVGAQLAGKSAPKTSTASVESGNALVRYASSKIAAPLVAESMATDVLGAHYKDAEFGKKLGAVLVEDRLRAIKNAFQRAGNRRAARKVNSLIGKEDSPFYTEAEFQAALADPEIRAAIDRHKQTVQPTAQEAHEEAGGTLAGPGLNTGAFVNLKAIFEGGEEALLSGGGRGNLMNPLRRPSRFSKTAAGTAERYETDYRTIAQRMIEGNFQESTKRQMYDQLVRDGLAKMTNPGEPAPTIGGKPAVKFVIERKGVPAGENKVRTYVKNLWVRSDLAGEVRQALNVDGPIQRSGIVNAATLLNRIQLAGPTDAVWHTANMLGSIAGSQGGKGVLVDMARKIPGVNMADAVGRVVASSIKVLAKTPEVQRQIAELADIGAMRAKGVAKPGKLAGIANFNHNVISLVDKAGRLVRDDMYKNLVSRGLVEDTVANRREWVNQMGQYNGRLMGQFQRFFKDAGFSPFIVAGRNFNRMAMRRITMDPGIKAISPKAWTEMRAVEAFGTIATLFAVPALANYLLTGSPGGRPGTKMGQIDTGKDDKGKHIVIDPAQWAGVRRGLRISGLQAVIEGAQRGETRGRITGNAIRDIMEGIIHPWAGPAVSAASVGYTGYSPVGYKESENPKDYGANIMTALQQLNPTVGALIKGKAKGIGGIKEAALSLGGAAGVKEVKPFTAFNKVGILHQGWLANNPDPKVKADYEQMQAATFPTSKYKSLDSALADRDEAGALKAIADLKAEGQKNKDILRRMRPFVGQGINSRTKPLFHESHKLEAAFKASLKPEQRAEYQKAIEERKATYQEFLKVWRKRDTAAKTEPTIDFVPD